MQIEGAEDMSRRNKFMTEEEEVARRPLCVRAETNSRKARRAAVLTRCFRRDNGTASSPTLVYRHRRCPREAGSAFCICDVRESATVRLTAVFPQIRWYRRRFFALKRGSPPVDSFLLVIFVVTQRRTALRNAAGFVQLGFGGWGWRHSKPHLTLASPTGTPTFLNLFILLNRVVRV